MMPRIGFIGAGNMARALMTGLVQAQGTAATLSAYDVAAEKTAQLTETLPVTACASLSEICQRSELLVLAIKPQGFAALLPQLKPCVEQQVIVSVAAGITCDVILRGLAQTAYPIVRAMPNTPALIQCGATGLYAGAEVTPTQAAWVEDIFASVGKTVWCEQESQLDIVTALSGSGPAYYFLLTECLIEAAVRAGLPPAQAALLAGQTALGSAQLLAHADIDAGQLREQVTSPGGTTAAALACFTENKFDDIVGQAVTAAIERAKLLAQSGEQSYG